MLVFIGLILVYGLLFVILAVSKAILDKDKKPPTSSKAATRKAAAKSLRQHRIIPALRLKHRSGGCGTSPAVSVLRIMRYCPKSLLVFGYWLQAIIHWLSFYVYFALHYPSIPVAITIFLYSLLRSPSSILPSQCSCPCCYRKA